MLIMVQTMFVFSCSGDDEVMLGNVIKLSTDSVGSSSSSAVVARPSSSSVVAVVSSSSVLSSSSDETEIGEDSSSSSETEVSEDSSSSEASSSSSEVSSSSSEVVSSSSNVVACTSGPGSPVTHGGQTYQTVKIGCQTWMAENLNYSASGSVCPDNEPDNCGTYGRWYDWATAMSACPSGWRIPSDADWNTLMEYVQTQNGGTYTPGNASGGGTASLAGNHLKAESGWSNNNGLDTYGFKALPGGYGASKDNLGNGYVGTYSVWWSSTENGDNAYRRSISSSSVNRGSYTKNNLYSVRCIKD
jgi:uncharacterized protein (TIGR02145 family)